MKTTHYSFHGLGIAVASDDAVSAALHSRLRQFPTNGHGPTDLTFEFYCIEDRVHHVKRPRGGSRPVYEPPMGDVVYFDAGDQLYIDYCDRVRVLCDPE